MAFVVPYDGSDLASAALARASEFQDAFDEPVVAVSIVPTRNAEFAAERVGFEPEGHPEPETVVSELSERVERIAPDAEFQFEVVEKYAPAGKIANQLRRVARNLDAKMVFIGSDNAGKMVNTLASIGSSVAADTAYDVVIVRHTDL